MHHGIMGMKWGTRNGPPYPLSGGQYTATEIGKIYKERKWHPNSIYNKKHFDKVVKENTKLRTLSYDKNRTKDVDMFYAAYTKKDKNQYNALFNRKLKKPILDDNGQQISANNGYKYKIDNKVVKNMKVASEDSGAKAFMNLYQNNSDFINFVTDPNRMQSQFVDSKYKFKGYRESKAALDRMADKNYKPTDKDLKAVYRMYNYTIPSDGAGNARASHDVYIQRAKFFNELKKNGYGAVLDTNDAIYGSFKADAPIIVFDMDQTIPAGVKDTSIASKKASELIVAGQKTITLGRH